MSDRLPPRVVCAVDDCGRVVPLREARREAVCYVRARKGGSLSSVRGLHFTDRWLCDRCANAGRRPQGLETAAEALDRARAQLEGRPRGGAQGDLFGEGGART